MRPGIASGVGHALGGLRLIAAPGVRAYVALPLAINVVLFALALWALGAAVDWTLERYLAAWPEWLHGLLWLVFTVIAAGAVFFGFALVANVVASPFNGLLAAAVEAHLGGDVVAAPPGWRTLGREVLRGLGGELRKFLYIALRALPLLLLSLVPGLNLLAPPLWLLFGAWMLALEYLDCPLANHDQPFPSALEHLRAHRGMALGFGAVVTVLTLLPVVNFIAMPVGVAGATSLYVRFFRPATP